MTTITDRMDALIESGLGPTQAGRVLGLSKKQIDSAWERVKARHARIGRHTVSRNIDDRTLLRLAQPRDPCPRCGVRGDVDCGHAPVMGGRLLCL